MAISINEVYQTVLAVANKEQRGYITPQEFNLFAHQAQLDIFQQYFYDLNQFRRNPGNDTVIGDIGDFLEEKIDSFLTTATFGVDNNTGQLSLGGVVSGILYKIFSLRVSYIGGVAPNVVDTITTAEQSSLKDFTLLNKSLLTKPTIETPLYYVDNWPNIMVAPTIPDLSHLNPTPLQMSASLTYVKKPKMPNWTYIIVNNKPLYNVSANDHQDFELHMSEKPLLVKKILQLAGVSVKDYNITQFAAQEEIKTIQQQKS